MTSKEALCQVTAPHFTAGLVLRDDIVVKAAPIIYWMVSKTSSEVKRYCKQKGWTFRCPNPT